MDEFESTGFCVSVGCPVTSPGRDDIPGSRLVPLLSSVVLGAEGRATLPAVSWPELGELTPPRVSVWGAGLVPMLSLFDEPVSVPEVVGLFGDAGVVGLVFVSSDEGVSDGEVRVRCIESLPLRPCDLWCFFIFLSDLSEEEEPDTDSEELPAAELPLPTLLELSLPTPVAVEAAPRLGTALEEVSRLEVLSGSGFRPGFASVSAEGAEFAAGLLLGKEVFELEVFEELPGSALLFWSAGSVADPLSSVVWLFGVVVVLVWSLAPVPVAVCARAPNALSARANAARAMIFTKVSLVVVRRRWPPPVVNPTDEAPCARSAKREGAGCHLPLPTRDPSLERLAYALKLEPQPHVCLAFGFLKLNPLCPNWPST